MYSLRSFRKLAICISIVFCCNILALGVNAGTSATAKVTATTVYKAKPVTPTPTVKVSTPQKANVLSTPDISTMSLTASVCATDELIVKFKTDADESKMKSKHSLKSVKKNAKTRANRVKIPTGKTVADMINTLKTDSTVEFVQPNYVMRTLSMPNDPSVGTQWHIPALKADLSWNTTKGSSSVVIAIVDTGVMTSHPDLSANLLPGYNTITNSADANDDNGHGTHAAGIAAGVIDNGIGIAGVAGGSKILPVKVMSSSGTGYDADIAEGIIWAADHGANIINLSLGMYTPSPNIQSAIDYAYFKKCVVIAAAGNDNTSAPAYPANCYHTIAVSATNQSNQKTSFSNYGPSIDVAAPGSGIYATTFEGGYGFKDGTSMAAPTVSGVVALMLSVNSALTPDQVEAILKYNATDLGSTGRDDFFGNGLVNAQTSVAEALAQASGSSIVTYNGNGHTGGAIPMDSNNYASASTVTVRPNSGNLVKTGYMFNGWNTSPDGSGTNYQPSNTFIMGNNNVILYARWMSISASPTPASTVAPHPTSEPTPTIAPDATPTPIPFINTVSCKPNPFIIDGTLTNTVKFVVNNGCTFNAKLYDSSNTLVSTLASTTFPAGAIGKGTITWNGVNGGSLLPDGDYKIKLTAVETTTGTTNTSEISLGIVRQTSATADIAIITPTATPPVFVPTGFNKMTVPYSLSNPAKVTIEIHSAAGKKVVSIIKKVKQNSGSQSFSWDGMINGAIALDGKYAYVITAINIAGLSTTTVTGNFLVDSRIPTIENLAAKKLIFKADGTTTNDIAYTLSENCTVLLTISNAGGTVLKTLVNDLQTRGKQKASWDGKNTSGVLQSNGAYTYTITVVDRIGQAAPTLTGTFKLFSSATNPTATASSAGIFTPNGSNNIGITYSLPFEAAVTTSILFGSKKIIALETAASKTNGTYSLTWDGKDAVGAICADGVYTYQITTKNAGGFISTPVSGTFILDCRNPELAGLKVALAKAIDGSSILKIDFTQSEVAVLKVVVLDSADNTVKTIQNANTASGKKSYTWDFKNDSGSTITNGTYTLSISAVDSQSKTSNALTGTIVKN